jgi:hypothetical protein
MKAEFDEFGYVRVVYDDGVTSARLLSREEAEDLMLALRLLLAVDEQLQAKTPEP